MTLRSTKAEKRGCDVLWEATRYHLKILSYAVPVKKARWNPFLSGRPEPPCGLDGMAQVWKVPKVVSYRKSIPIKNKKVIKALEREIAYRWEKMRDYAALDMFNAVPNKRV